MTGCSHVCPQSPLTATRDRVPASEMDCVIGSYIWGAAAGLPTHVVPFRTCTGGGQVGMARAALTILENFPTSPVPVASVES